MMEGGEWWIIGGPNQGIQKEALRHTSWQGRNESVTKIKGLRNVAREKWVTVHEDMGSANGAKSLRPQCGQAAAGREVNLTRTIQMQTSPMTADIEVSVDDSNTSITRQPAVLQLRTSRSEN